MLDRLADSLVQQLLHPPRRTSRPLPETLVARAADVAIPAVTGPLKAWLISAEGEAAGTVVVVHGWGGDAGGMAPLAAHLVASGLTALLVDLPGHGRTGPAASYNVKLMVDDLTAVRDWVAARDDRKRRPVAILGFSFGGLGAYVAASRDPRWASLVVVAAPIGPMEAVRLYLDGKGIPGRWFDGIIRRSFVRAIGVPPETFDAAPSLASIQVPVMIVHGEADEVVPVWQGERLAEAVPAALRTLMLVPGMSHSAVLTSDEVGVRVARFLAAHLAPTTEGS